MSRMFKILVKSTESDLLNEKPDNNGRQANIRDQIIFIEMN